MVTGQQLSQLQFFSGLNQAQLDAVAEISAEIRCDGGTVLFEEGLPVDALHLLLEGCVELYYSTSADPHDQRLVCEIEAGEPFAISALIEPYGLTATAIASRPCRVLKMRAQALRPMLDRDAKLGYHFMRRVAKTAMMRLHCARMRLAIGSAGVAHE